MRHSITRVFVAGLVAGMACTFAVSAQAFFLRMSAADCFVNRSSSSSPDQFSSGGAGGLFLNGSSSNINDRQAFCPYPETEGRLKHSLRTVNLHGFGSSHAEFQAAACLTAWNGTFGFCGPLVTSTKVGQQRVDLALGAPEAWSVSGDGHFPYVWVRSDQNSNWAFLRGLFFRDS